MVAIQLNMIDDAKELYTKCNRFDLLANMLAAQGDWDEAIELSTKQNMINLKNIYYQLACTYEQQKQIDKAIQFFIKSNTHRTEVPRMLCKQGMFEKLMQFVESQKDPEIYKWWGMYLES